MRPLHLPLLRTLSVACVLAYPTLEELVPPQLYLTPFATLGQCGDTSPDEPRETQRERNQRVDDVFKALGARPGAVVADIGAGPGFYTVRLARAVGETGRVYAVDVSSSTVRNLRARVEREGIGNVEVIEGAVDDPKLPDGSLDAALIVNAYHEMTEHQAMLAHIRRALKPEGRLVILEPISPSRRAAPRSDQTRRHEIASELVLQEARAAGFKITNLEEPFSRHSGHGVEWLMVLTPGEPEPSGADHDHGEEFGDVKSAGLRIERDEFARLLTSGQVVVLDVRDEAMFQRGHIPGARLAPMSALRDMAEGLKAAGVPIVTYCSCPAEETSARAVLHLRKLGVTNARALVGGYEGWKTQRQ